MSDNLKRDLLDAEIRNLVSAWGYVDVIRSVMRDAASESKAADRENNPSDAARFRFLEARLLSLAKWAQEQGSF